MRPLLVPASIEWDRFTGAASSCGTSGPRPDAFDGNRASRRASPHGSARPRPPERDLARHGSGGLCFL